MIGFPFVFNKKIFHPLNVLIFCFLIAIPIWIFFVAPFFTNIPQNFTYKADVISVDNFFDPTVGDFKGEQYSKTLFSYEVISKKGNNLVIKNSFDVKTLDGKQIFKAEPVYGIDARTGAHVKGTGDRDREGYLFAPRGLKKGKSFTYWHVDSNVPALMKYVDEENLYGLPVYKYETDYGGEIDQTKTLSFLPDVGKTKGVKLLSKNTLWIEPVSGYLVKQQDSSLDYYYYDLQTGKKLSSYNQFSNRFSEESIKQQTIIATNKKYVILLVKNIIPVSLFLFACLLYFLTFQQGKRLRKFLSQNRASLIIFGFLFTLTIISYVLVNQAIYQKNQKLLEKETIEVKDSIEKLLNGYFSVLLGSRGLFDASENVSRTEWHDYVSSIGINERFSGLSELGYAKVVVANKKSDFIKSVQAEGFTDYSVFPVNVKTLFVPILYAEPLNEQNKKDLGNDLSENPILKRAMLLARDSGEIAVSGKFDARIINKDINKTTFFMFVPVYKRGFSTITLDEKINAIDGYVYGVFNTDIFLKQVVGSTVNNIDFHIFDGLKIDNDSLLFDFEKKNESISSDVGSIFKKVETIYVDGRPWTIEYFNLKSFFGETYDRLMSFGVLIGGISLSLFSFAFIFTLSLSKRRAIAYAEVVNKDLLKTATELQERNKEIAAKMVETEKLNKVMIDRELAMIELKKKL